MYKKHYQHFLNARPQITHFACHSHHYWPDVTRQAQLQYWDDCAFYVDDKWSHFFGRIVPQVQKLISKNLNISQPEQIVFAPNTHEFVFRILSSLDLSKDLRILCTDAEFYSFDRQINRFSELPQVQVTKVPVEPFESFEERFIAEAKSKDYDLVFFSQVFFNSGFACDIDQITSALRETSSKIVIDGYHSFMAIPTDLSAHEDRVFYLAGSYKYAQGGEGGCFLYVPPSTQDRPLNTGWFAELAKLDNIQGKTNYPRTAMQYAGSTMDFSAIYRLKATLELFEEEGLSTKQIHAYVRNLQRVFLEEMKQYQDPLLNEKSLISSGEKLGHFLTFNLPDVEITKQIGERLKAADIVTDSRGQRLRFGFGLYLNEEDIRNSAKRIFNNPIA